MPFQISPGINISERDLTHVVPNVATSIGAMAGSFQWGPVLERITITTENELVKLFGKPDNDTFKSFFTAANYLAYSNNLIVVRNVAAAAKNAVVGDIDNGTNVLVKNKDNYDSSTYTDQLFIAKYPGALGNSLKAIAIDNFGWTAAVAAHANTPSTATADQKLFLSNFNGAPGSSQDVIAANGGSGTYNDEIHILVIDSGGQWTGLVGDVLEAHAYVSMAEHAKKIDGSSNYVKDVLSNESDYVWLGDVDELTANSDDTTPNARNAGSPKVGAVFKMFANSSAAYYPGGILGGSAGSLGVDANDLSVGEYNAGYNLYSNADVVDITLVMQGGATSVTGKYIIDTLASTGTRMDCVAFVSPNIDTVVAAGSISSTIATGVVADKTSMGSSNYAVMDSAWKYQYDQYNDVFRYVPMNADIAGLCARTDFTNDAWWSPAGMTRGQIKNIIKLSWDASKADRDTLYSGGANPFHAMTGTGVMLWGDKTMQVVPSAFDRINVRRLFIVMEKAISIAAKAMLFEFNDEFTRAQFVNMVAPFLREIQGRRGITDFKVVCDSSNNTGQVIDTNNFVGDIYVKPNRSINYIQLNFIAARSDVSFTEIGA